MTKGIKRWINTLKPSLPDSFLGQKNNRPAIIDHLKITQKQIKNASANDELRKELKQAGVNYKQLNQTEKIYTFYILPTTRFSIYLAQTGRQILPSLEENILKNFDPNYQDRIFDRKELISTGDEWEELLQKVEDSRSLEEVKSALMCWPDILKGITSWNEQSVETQKTLAHTVFALSTLCQDEFLLNKGFEIAPEMKVYFEAYIDAASNDTETTTQETQEEDTFSQEEWDENIELLATAISKAKEVGASIEILDEITSITKNLDDMRVSVSLKQDQVDKSALWIESLKEYSDNLFGIKDSHGRQLFEANTVEDVVQGWSSQIDTSEFDLEIYREKIKKAMQEVLETSREYLLLNEEINEVNKELDKLKKEEPKGLAEEHKRDENVSELHAQNLSLVKRRNKAYESLIKLAYFENIDQGQGEDKEKDSSEEFIEEPAEEKQLKVETKQEQHEAKNDAQNEELEKEANSPVDTVQQEINILKDRDTTKETGVSISKSDKKETSQTKSCPEKKGGGVASTKQKPKARAKKLLENEKVYFNLMSNGHLSLAYHWACSSKEDKNNSLYSFHSNLTACIPLARNIQYPDRENAKALSQFLSKVKLEDISGNGNYSRDAFNLLVLSAALRPSLIAPQTGASSLLRNVSFSEQMPTLYNLAQTFSKQGDLLQGNHIDTGVLKGVKSLAEWESNLEALLAEIYEWKEQAAIVSIKFAPARKVWRSWLHPGGFINNTLDLIINRQSPNSKKVKEQLDLMLDQAFVQNEIIRSDKRLHGKRRGGIDNKALTQLNSRIEEFHNLIHRWLIMFTNKPGESDFVRTQVQIARDHFNALHDKSIDEICSFKQKNNTLESVACANIAIQAIENLHQLFDHDTSLPASIVPPHIALNSELLLLPQIDLDEKWLPDRGNEAENVLRGNIKKSIKSFLNKPVTWTEAFKERLQRIDLEGSERILSCLEHINEDEALELKKEWEKAFKLNLDKLEGDSLEALRAIEKALYSEGTISESERDEYASRVQEILNQKDTTRRFNIAFSEIEQITNKIKVAKEKRIQEAMDRLAELHLDESEEAYQVIAKAIELGDLLSANEFIDKVLRGENDFTEIDLIRDVFSEFYQHSAKQIYDYLTSKKALSAHKVIERIRNGEGIPGVSMKHVRGPQAKQAAEMLKSWFDMKRTKSPRAEAMEKVLSGLGFHVENLSLVDRGNQEIKTFNLKTKTIRDRNICPIPTFGSDARGNYRIICVWNRPVEEFLVEASGDSHVNNATIFLNFGNMTQQSRRDLAAKSQGRGSRSTFLVLDETLLLFLCGERGLRLPAFFNCTLPFTSANAYVTTSSLVPPELFYGRLDESEAIIDPYGTCFIYGGRQLGKTALLRHVERRFHDPGNGRYAKWIDLKAEGIGTASRPEDIWVPIARSLKEMKILPDDIKDPNANVKGRLESFLQTVRSWFDSNPENRLLLLLDEADKFLDQDGEKEFSEASRLKNLMETTDRRFKVVFAGLHNVLRTTEQSNHPIAHLGQPKNIGPLLNDGEWREAAELIRKPLTSLGYRFESENLITRILAQTNYFPNLIQLYCKELLGLLRNDPRIQSGLGLDSFPRKITTKHLEDTFSSHKLRDHIRGLFHLTLQLDARYEVIAYTIANVMIEKRASLAEGVSVKTVRDETRVWWPEGFEETTDLEFSTLLQEMEGLGVLRANQQGKYTFRNPNVLLLMGTENEISDVLEKEREKPQEFSTTVFRPRDPSSKSSPRRSPLTFKQEAELIAQRKGVVLLCGSHATGLEDLTSFLRERFTASRCNILEGMLDLGAFKRKLQEINLSAEGTTLYVVPNTVPWSDDWLSAALNKVSRQTAKGKFLRFVFIADPVMTWMLLPHLENWEEQGLEHIMLRRWQDGFVRQWLEDHNLPNEKTIRDEIWVTTGNWPFLLGEIKISDKQLSNQLKKIGHTIKDNNHANSTLKAFGVDRPECKKSLELLNEFPDATLEEIAELAPLRELKQGELVNWIRWAVIMQIAIRESNEQLRLDHVVSSLLTAKPGA